jgi:Tfp pilus assembly protein FimT
VLIVAVLVAIAVPNTIRWQRDQRLKGAAHDVADLLVLARQATRRQSQVVVWAVRPQVPQARRSPVNGPVPFLVFNDGAAATSNCKVDGGEAKEWSSRRSTCAGVRSNAFAPGDPASGAFAPPQNRGGTALSPATRPCRG